MKDLERYSHVPLFTGLDASEVGELLDGSEEIEVEVGDVILREGEPGKGLFLVASGTFAVRREGMEDPLARLEDLAHFGEMSLLTNEPSSASVTCERAGRLRLLSTDRFGALLRRRDPLALSVVLNVARVLVRRLIRADERALLWSGGASGR